MDPGVSVSCCIAGGGPAGMMLGFLLARAGISVLVLEKHADFLRDFRGDTIHPSTLETMSELGLLDDFLQRPHQEVRTLGAQIGDEFVEVADFTHLPTHCRFIALMPQWDFLDFLAEHAKRFPAFQLKMEAEARDLTVESGVVTGLLATTPGGEIRVKADLVVAADGRHSTLRERAGLDVLDLGAPMDVLWMRLSRRPGDPGQTLGRVDTGRIFIMLNREDYWQCAYVIAKGGFDEVRARGLPALRQEIAGLAPYLRDRVDELQDWSDVKLLSVSVDRLRAWHRPGLLCIGDAAHAMSPIGGVGINLAIQDAVATANILTPKASPGFGFAAGSRSRAAPARVSDARDAAASGDPAEPRDRPRAGEQRKDVASIRGPSLGMDAVAAAAPRPPHRPRLPPRACKCSRCRVEKRRYLREHRHSGTARGSGPETMNTGL